MSTAFVERHEPQNRPSFDWAEPRVAEDGTKIFYRPDKREPGRGKARLGNGLLIVASVLLFAVAAAAMIVSFKAQYEFVMAEKHDHTSAVLEALLLDGGAVIVALVGLALSLKGMSALMCRALNILFIGASITMNAFSSNGEFTSLSVWVLAPVVYAATSDLLIANVRRLMVEEIEDGPIKKARGVLLWTLRLIFGPVTTIKGFRAWVLTLPTGPAHESKIVLPALPTEQPGEQRAEQVPSLPIVTAERVPTEQSREQGAEQVVKALPTARRALPAKQSREQVTAQVSELSTEFRTGTAARREQVRALLSVEELTDGQVAARLGIGRSTAQRDRKALGL